MGTYIEPFDFKKIFIEYFLGSQELFIFAFTILISFISAKAGASNRIFLVVLSISSLMFSSILGEPIYVLIIFIVGLVSFKSMARLFT